MPSDAASKDTHGGDFPTPQFSTVFADAVGSLANSPTIVKFFLSRFEPSFVGDGKSQLQPFAQVIMPVDGFASMFVFFEAHLKTMINAGHITETRLTELRSIFSRQETR